MNIAVFFGGKSSECDVSKITGLQLIANLGVDYNVIPIFINKFGEWIYIKNLLNIDFDNAHKKCTLVPGSNFLYILKNKKLKRFLKIDFAIFALHGLNGEDGAFCGLMNLCSIPYSSCDIFSSSLCLDKGLFKLCCKGLGVGVVEGITLNKFDFVNDKDCCLSKINKLSYPVILKPCRQGSSIGIFVCNDEDEFLKNIYTSFEFDDKVLIEKYVDVKKEVNIALFSDKDKIIFSNTEEPVSKNLILSFNDKYLNNSLDGVKRIIPADIDVDTLNKIKNISSLLYTELNMFGIVRFDFILTNHDELFINEVNTIPGSFAYYLFDKNKYTYKKLIDKIIYNSFFRFKHTVQFKEYVSNIGKRGIDGLKK